MTTVPTLVLVHAHPDDEVFFGAGASAHYGALGHRVVLITCTNGQLGFDPEGRAGVTEGHDELATKHTRMGELQVAATTLGISRVVTLGYDDSGMAGWATNERPTAFMNADVDAVARVIAAIIEEEGAVVAITYDEHGFYGHPDHVQANVVTRRALELSATLERLYYCVVPRGVIERFRRGAEELGVELPAWVLDASVNVDDALVATTLDVSDYAVVKQRAMAAHASQIDNDGLVGMRQDLFTLLFGTEYFQRAWSRHDTSGDETDLFGGL